MFNFHGYPWLIHRLAYRFKGHDNLHVRGYKEKGNINTPMELAMLNETSRFHLVIDVIDRVPKLRTTAAHLKEEMGTRSSTTWRTPTSTEPTARRSPTGCGRTRQGEASPADPRASRAAVPRDAYEAGRTCRSARREAAPIAWSSCRA